MFDFLKYILKAIKASKSNPHLYKGSLPAIPQTQTLIDVSTPHTLLDPGETDLSIIVAKINELVTATNNLNVQNNNCVADVNKILDVLRTSTGHNLIKDY